MEPWGSELRGRLDERELESEVLRDNPLGDPHRRPLWIYLPPGYEESDRRYPSIYVIQGLTGQLDMWRNRAPFRRNFPELADELFAREEAPPAILVYVDCWTSLGGSQFLDSPGTGRYHTYLCDEIVPWVDANYRTLAVPEHRGIAGKSSGGYGAMVTPMLRPDLFGGLATHAGDALFETCYLREIGEAARALRDEYDGSYERFWEDFRSRPAFSKDSDHVLLDSWCMAACYSADGTAPSTSSSRRRRVVRPLLEGLPQPTCPHQEERRHAAQRLVHGRLLLGRRGRDGAAPVRHHNRRAAAGDLGALARVGSGADGCAARGRGALAEGRLHRRR